jgi:hypothetical protein
VDSTGGTGYTLKTSETKHCISTWRIDGAEYTKNTKRRIYVLYIEQWWHRIDMEHK